jgi:hypothetical protein
MLRLDFKTVCARVKKLKPDIEISHKSRLDHSEIIDLSYRAKKDDCTMTGAQALLGVASRPPTLRSSMLIGPSGVRALPLAAGINEGGQYFRYFGPSEVRALPLAAGINVGGHYF